jgi:hypothetical protein
MALFLSRDELAEISGRKQRGKIAEWLTANGYRFDIAADGWPRVLRAAVDAKLMPTSGKRTMQRKEPDFSAYGTSTKAA